MARLISVNVGRPRVVPWNGQLVRTAIWKSPVGGRIRAGTLNLAGDGQADLEGHGGEQRAVMVYQADSYRYWSELLGRSDLLPGSFGENFTVEGLPDNQVCVGDRFRIGGAVFEVSQPRVTCYKLGLKLGEPRMPALVVAHGRPGFYLRVIEEGEVGAGDAIEKIADGPEGLTVAQVDGLLYGPNHPVEDVRRALRIPALSPGWQWSMREMLKAADDGRSSGNAGLSGATLPLAWQGFRRLRVTGTRNEGESVKWIELAAPDGEALPKRRAGQHIVLRLPAADGAATVTRIYSLCGELDAPRFEIAVKAQGGPGSRFIHEHLSRGDELDVGAPRGDFLLRDGAGPVVLLSAGIGVTPVLSMLRALAGKPSSRAVWWVHSAHNRRQHSFAAAARDLVRRIPDARSIVFHGFPDQGELQGADFDRRGRLGPDEMAALGLPEGADYYLCGPPRYIGEMTANLRQLGVQAVHIFSEAFGGAAGAASSIIPHLPAGEPGNGPAVTFLRSGISLPWDDRYGSLLALAEACDVPVKWSCRSGVCRSCESGLIDGEVAYAPDPIEPPAPGRTLLCCARPSTALALDT